MEVGGGEGSPGSHPGSPRAFSCQDCLSLSLFFKLIFLLINVFFYGDIGDIFYGDIFYGEIY